MKKLLTLAVGAITSQPSNYFLYSFLVTAFMLKNFAFLWWAGFNSGTLLSYTLSSLVLALVIFLPVLVLRKVPALIYIFAVELLLMAYFFTTFGFFRFHRKLIQPGMLRYGETVGQVSDLMSTLIEPQAVLTVSLPVLVLTGLLLGRGLQSWARMSTRELRPILALVLVLFVSILTLEFIAQHSIAGLYSQTTKVESRTGKLSPLGAFLINGVHYYNPPVQAGSDQSRARELILAQQFAHSRYEGTLAGRNVIYVEMESLEKWLVEGQHDGQPLMPNLHRLAQEGMYFPNYYFQIGASSTSAAEFTALTGLYSLTDRDAFTEDKPVNFPTLPGLLKDQGYETSAYHGYWGDFWSRRTYYPKLHIDRFLAQEEMLGQPQLLWGVSDEAMFSVAAEDMRRTQEPFFALAVTLTLHPRYEGFPEELNSIDIPDHYNIGEYDESYVQVARYTDRAIGHFLAQLEQNGQLDNSIIVFYGDHTTFHENIGLLTKHFNGEPQSGLELDRLSQTPLIIYAPGSDLPTGSQEAVASTVDIAPTILNLLGIARPDTMPGQDLLNAPWPVAIARNSPLNNSVVITGELVYFNNDDGVFEKGTCLKQRSYEPLEVEACRAVFERELLKTGYSDAVYFRGQ